MKYRPLGKTNVQVSEIGFGCGDNAGLMVEGEPKQRREVVERALEVGITYFDTSSNYGEGRSESNLGATLKELRARPFVATKVRLTATDLEDVAAGVLAQFEASLRRLQMDAVDLYYLHTRVAPERRLSGGGPTHVSVEDVVGPIWETFRKLREQGRTRFLGICTTGSEVSSIRRVLDNVPFEVIQSQYNILNPTEGRPPPEGFQGQDFGQTIEDAREKGMGVVTYRALAAGALAQKADATVRPSPSRSNAGWHADIERAQALEFLKEPGEEKLAGVAVRYALTNPSVASVLLGFSRKEYVDEANNYSDAGALPSGLLTKIDSLYANDFGRAPKEPDPIRSSP